jgi:preprotein translocase subunit SecD
MRRFGATALVAILAASVGASAGTEKPPEKKPSGFSTEIRLAVETTKVDVSRLSRAEEKRMEEVLRLRLPIFTLNGSGTASVQGATAIKVTVPVDSVTPLQLTSFTRAGRLEIRHLDNLRTSENPGGRYDLNVLSITDSGEQRSSLRFFDHKNARPVPVKEFLSGCSVIAGGEDVEVATVVTSGALMAVRVQFTTRGSRKLNDFAKKPGRVLGVVLDGEVISISAVVGRAKKPKGEKKGPEEDVSQIDVLGGFQSPEEANYLATILTAGPLPVPLKVAGHRLVPE